MPSRGGDHFSPDLKKRNLIGFVFHRHNKRETNCYSTQWIQTHLFLSDGFQKWSAQTARLVQLYTQTTGIYTTSVLFLKWMQRNIANKNEPLSVWRWCIFIHCTCVLFGIHFYSSFLSFLAWLLSRVKLMRMVSIHGARKCAHSIRLIFQGPISFRLHEFILFFFAFVLNNNGCCSRSPAWSITQ